jgi:hypothetical protein
MTKRMVKMLKLYILDTGLCAYLTELPGGVICLTEKPLPLTPSAWAIPVAAI